MLLTTNNSLFEASVDTTPDFWSLPQIPFLQSKCSLKHGPCLFLSARQVATLRTALHAQAASFSASRAQAAKAVDTAEDRIARLQILLEARARTAALAQERAHIAEAHMQEAKERAEGLATRVAALEDEVAEAPWSIAEWAVALRFDNPRA